MWWLKPGWLVHERMAAHAALLPANCVINSLTRPSSFFPPPPILPASLSLSLSLLLSLCDTHLFLLSPSLSRSNLARSCFSQWEHNEEGGRGKQDRSWGGEGRGGEGKSESHTPPHPPPSFTSLPAILNQTWQLFNFPKAKSNLQLSSAHWHTATLEGFSHHPPFAARFVRSLTPPHMKTHTHAKPMHREGERSKSKVDKIIS